MEEELITKYQYKINSFLIKSESNEKIIIFLKQKLEFIQINFPNYQKLILFIIFNYIDYTLKLISNKSIVEHKKILIKLIKISEPKPNFNYLDNIEWKSKRAYLYKRLAKIYEDEMNISKAIENLRIAIYIEEYKDNIPTNEFIDLYLLLCNHLINEKNDEDAFKYLELCEKYYNNKFDIKNKYNYEIKEMNNKEKTSYLNILNSLNQISANKDKSEKYSELRDYFYKNNFTPIEQLIIKNKEFPLINNEKVTNKAVLEQEIFIDKRNISNKKEKTRNNIKNIDTKYTYDDIEKDKIFESQISKIRNKSFTDNSEKFKLNKQNTNINKLSQPTQSHTGKVKKYNTNLPQINNKIITKNELLANLKERKIKYKNLNLKDNKKNDLIRIIKKNVITEEKDNIRFKFKNFIIENKEFEIIKNIIPNNIIQDSVKNNSYIIKPIINESLSLVSNQKNVEKALINEMNNYLKSDFNSEVIRESIKNEFINKVIEIESNFKKITNNEKIKVDNILKSLVKDQIDIKSQLFDNPLKYLSDKLNNLNINTIHILFISIIKEVVYKVKCIIKSIKLLPVKMNLITKKPTIQEIKIELELEYIQINNKNNKMIYIFIIIISEEDVFIYNKEDNKSYEDLSNLLRRNIHNEILNLMLDESYKDIYPIILYFLDCFFEKFKYNYITSIDNRFNDQNINNEHSHNYILKEIKEINMIYDSIIKPFRITSNNTKGKENNEVNENNITDNKISQISYLEYFSFAKDKVFKYIKCLTQFLDVSKNSNSKYILNIKDIIREEILFKKNKYIDYLLSSLEYKSFKKNLFLNKIVCYNYYINENIDKENNIKSNPYYSILIKNKIDLFIPDSTIIYSTCMSINKRKIFITIKYRRFDSLFNSNIRQTNNIFSNHINKNLNNQHLNSNQVDNLIIDKLNYISTNQNVKSIFDDAFKGKLFFNYYQTTNYIGLFEFSISEIANFSNYWKDIYYVSIEDFYKRIFNPLIEYDHREEFNFKRMCFFINNSYIKIFDIYCSYLKRFFYITDGQVNLESVLYFNDNQKSIDNIKNLKFELMIKLRKFIYKNYIYNKKDNKIEKYIKFYETFLSFYKEKIIYIDIINRLKDKSNIIFLSKYILSNTSEKDINNNNNPFETNEKKRYKYNNNLEHELNTPINININNIKCILRILLIQSKEKQIKQITLKIKPISKSIWYTIEVKSLAMIDNILNIIENCFEKERKIILIRRYFENILTFNNGLLGDYLQFNFQKDINYESNEENSFIRLLSYSSHEKDSFIFNNKRIVRLNSLNQQNMIYYNQKLDKYIINFRSYNYIDNKVLSKENYYSFVSIYFPNKTLYRHFILYSLHLNEFFKMFNNKKVNKKYICSYSEFISIFSKKLCYINTVNNYSYINSIQIKLFNISKLKNEKEKGNIEKIDYNNDNTKDLHLNWLYTDVYLKLNVYKELSNEFIYDIDLSERKLILRTIKNYYIEVNEFNKEGEFTYLEYKSYKLSKYQSSNTSNTLNNQILTCIVSINYHQQLDFWTLELIFLKTSRKFYCNIHQSDLEKIPKEEFSKVNIDNISEFTQEDIWDIIVNSSYLKSNKENNIYFETFNGYMKILLREYLIISYDIQSNISNNQIYFNRSELFLKRNNRFLLSDISNTINSIDTQTEFIYEYYSFDNKKWNRQIYKLMDFEEEIEEFKILNNENIEYSYRGIKKMGYLLKKIHNSNLIVNNNDLLIESTSDIKSYKTDNIMKHILESMSLIRKNNQIKEELKLKLKEHIKHEQIIYEELILINPTVFGSVILNSGKHIIIIRLYYTKKKETHSIEIGFEDIINLFFPFLKSHIKFNKIEIGRRILHYYKELIIKNNLILKLFKFGNVI